MTELSHVEPFGIIDDVDEMVGDTSKSLRIRFGSSNVEAAVYLERIGAYDLALPAKYRANREVFPTPVGPKTIMTFGGSVLLDAVLDIFRDDLFNGQGNNFAPGGFQFLGTGHTDLFCTVNRRVGKFVHVLICGNQVSQRDIRVMLCHGSASSFSE
jgi:hypothetical protein